MSLLYLCGCLVTIGIGLQMLHEYTDLVPLLVPAKGGGSQAVRVVLTSSKEDKDVLEVSRKKSILTFQVNLSIVFHQLYLVFFFKHTEGATTYGRGT